MSKKKGRSLVFNWDSTKVGNVTAISLNVDGEIINVSDWDSGEWNEKLAGRKDWTMDISLFHNPEDDTAQGDMETDMFSASRSGTASFGPDTPVADDVTYSGDVIMSNFTVDASGSDEAITSSFTLEGNGALTRSVEASS